MNSWNSTSDISPSPNFEIWVLIQEDKSLAKISIGDEKAESSKC